MENEASEYLMLPKVLQEFLTPGDLLQCQYQGMSAFFTMPLSLNRQVELVDQRQPREGNAHLFCFSKSQAHVFDEVFDKETRVEITIENARCQVVQGPARCGPTAYGLEHHFKVQSRFVTIKQAFANPDHGS